MKEDGKDSKSLDDLLYHCQSIDDQLDLTRKTIMDWLENRGKSQDLDKVNLVINKFTPIIDQLETIAADLLNEEEHEIADSSSEEEMLRTVLADLSRMELDWMAKHGYKPQDEMACRMHAIYVNSPAANLLMNVEEDMAAGTTPVIRRAAKDFLTPQVRQTPSQILTRGLSVPHAPSLLQVPDWASNNDVFFTPGLFPKGSIMSNFSSAKM